MHTELRNRSPPGLQGKTSIHVPKDTALFIACSLVSLKHGWSGAPLKRAIWLLAVSGNAHWQLKQHLMCIELLQNCVGAPKLSGCTSQG